MSKWIYLSIGLIGITLVIWPVRSWATPQLYQSGTVPTSTVAPIVLQIENLYTVPENVIAGEQFELNFRIRNPSAVVLDTLAVTVHDVAADQFLIGSAPNKTVYLTNVGFNLTTLVSQQLLYDSEIAGGRQLAVILKYTYPINGELTTNIQTETISIVVLKPTPTPTVTLTPTPTNTWTPVPDLAATEAALARAVADALATTLASTPIPDLAAAETPQTSELNTAVAVTLTAVSTPEPSVEGAPNLHNSANDSIAYTDMIVEFADVPASLQAGQLFTMTLLVRNISRTATAKAVIVEWVSLDNAMILPSGMGMRWFAGDLAVEDSYSITGQFYVTADAPPGIQTAEIVVIYQLDDITKETREQINLLIQSAEQPPTPPVTAPARPASPPTAQEPAWLRFLRALFGIHVPTDDTN